MNGGVIKFGKAKKQIFRSRKKAQAAENRVKFGLTKAEKRRDTSDKSAAKKHIDDHKRKDK